MEDKKIYEIPTVEVTHFEFDEILTDSGRIELPGVGWGQ